MTQLIDERIKEVLEELVKSTNQKCLCFMMTRENVNDVSQVLTQLNQLYKIKYLGMLPKEVKNTAMGGADTPVFQIPLVNALLMGNELEARVYNDCIAEMKKKINE